MNALWLERMSDYRTSPFALESAKVLLQTKDIRRSHLLKRYRRNVLCSPYESLQTFEAVLLNEARNARSFWLAYASLLPAWCRPFRRQPRGADVVNRLLDVGYHHIAGVVEKIILAKEISSSLGLIHRAHRAKSKPLVYDLMELFRADTVDFTLLRYLRLKKKPILDPQAHIGHFLSNVNRLRDKLYYLRDFKQCHRYSYYMELQVVKFIKAVNRREVFKPLTLPRRHESRCKSPNLCPTCLTGVAQESTIESGTLP